MSALLIAFILSLVGTLAVIRYQNLHGWFSADIDFSGVQKFHDRPVPRIGGLPVVLAVLVAMICRLFENMPVGGFGFMLLVTTLPAFGSGFV